MPRFNVEHNGKWACFSTIPDGFITVFAEKSDYEEWRLEEYGRVSYKPSEDCNIMTMSEAVSSASLNHSKEEVICDLLEAGISPGEADTLYETYKENLEEV
jgi:hypothetical protein